MEMASTLKVSVPAPPSGARAACLVNIYPAGPDRGRCYVIGPTPLVIGRDEGCDAWVGDPAVSRRHARVQPAMDGYYAVDFRSRNGTFVNEHRITKQKLHDGDYVRVGSTIFRFLDQANIEAAYHEEVYRLTILDALTGLPNRRYLLDFLDHELARWERYQRSLGLVLMDVDHFKEINDTLGHLGGDAALRQLADCLKARVRSGDLLARYGGEEFALALVEADLEGAAVVAEDLRRLIEQTSFQYQGRPFGLTISLGIAATQGGAQIDVARFFQQADQRLYQAKRAGRNAAVA
jgi:diguanylate cyclase (GGDEF)-like protein